MSYNFWSLSRALCMCVTVRSRTYIHRYHVHSPHRERIRTLIRLGINCSRNLSKTKTRNYAAPLELRPQSPAYSAYCEIRHWSDLGSCPFLLSHSPFSRNFKITLSLLRIPLNSLPCRDAQFRFLKIEHDQKGLSAMVAILYASCNFFTVLFLPDMCE